MATPVLAIKIEDAVRMMGNNSLLLPAIQREFVWKKQAIELMFDSMLRGYPINTLMFWKINNICQQPLDFYSFLGPNYTYGVTRNTIINKQVNPLGDKLIVIDGQQRLTSIYIGLYGTYQTVKGKPMSLYLRLDQAGGNDKKYDFRFLSSSQLKTIQKQGGVWFKMNDLTAPGFNVFSLLATNGALVNNSFALDTMKKLDQLLGSLDYLHYYDISGYNSIDDVLDIFTRTNDSGTPLTKGDLLLSVLTTEWFRINKNDNARDFVKNIIDDVKLIGYKIDRDWVIKCSLVVFSDNVKMLVSNFTSTKVKGQPLTSVIHTNRDDFKKAIIAAFNQIARFGLLEKGLSTKLAVIPIVQYIYEKNLSTTINKAKAGHIGHSSDGNVQKWLFRAIVTNLFESGTDAILTKVKDIISNYATKTDFPYQEIEKLYNQLDIKDPNIDQFLLTQKVSAFPILNIIFKDKIAPGKQYDMDHTHPEVVFKNLNGISFTTIDDKKLACDGVTYNSVKNLQLLQVSPNRSKNKMSLSGWVNAATNPNQLMLDHCIPTNVSLDIADFGKYIVERSKLLATLLKQNLLLPVPATSTHTP